MSNAYLRLKAVLAERQRGVPLDSRYIQAADLREVLDLLDELECDLREQAERDELLNQD